MNRNQKPIYRLWWIAIAPLAILAIDLKGLAAPQSANREGCEVGQKFAFIPAGKFISGSDRQERNYGYQISAEAFASESQGVSRIKKQLQTQAWFEDEQSRQIRSLPAFCIQRNLVTNAEYQKFIQATKHRSPGISATEYQQQGFLVHSYDEVKPYLWEGDRYPPKKGKYPVVLVSYEDAIAYARWKGRQDGQSYRLPTEAEWEKAARGENGRYFPWGNRWENNATNWAKSGINGTSEIATFPLSRSLYGVEDMAGNVFEFTSTLRQRKGQQISVMKGCSWDDSPGFCRAAYQHTRPIKSRHILFGFRLVKLQQK